MSSFTAPWAAFYAITGTGAASLTGLTFVVITLVAQQERLQRNLQDGVETFTSPTVVHFCAALLVSGILAAPWRSPAGPEVLLVLTSMYGVIFAARVLMRMAKMSVRASYLPGFDDWFWYTITPLATYLTLLVGAAMLGFAPEAALYVLGAAAIALIFIGIRNSWDTVTFVTMEAARERTKRQPRE
jgi:hypothetical protein